MGSTDNSAIMTIDLKWNRFRIHKSTLNKMGNPLRSAPHWWHLQPSEVGSNITPLFC